MNSCYRESLLASVANLKSLGELDRVRVAIGGLTRRDIDRRQRALATAKQDRVSAERSAEKFRKAEYKKSLKGQL